MTVGPPNAHGTKVQEASRSAIPDREARDAFGSKSVANRHGCGNTLLMAVSEPIRVARGETALVGECRAGEGPTVVLLHAGVTDRRSWRQVTDALDGAANVVAYDRRGFGETAPSKAPFSHAGDLIAVLDHLGILPAWLVGSSAGGGIALDTALLAPERVAGLVLIAPAVSGAPAPELDEDTARFDRLLDQAVVGRRPG